MLSYIPQEVQEKITTKLQNLHKVDLVLEDFKFSSGGCINQAGVVKTTHGSFFIKWNSRSRFPGMFQTEADGLNLLKSSKTFRVPEVIFFEDTHDYSLILMEVIESAVRSKNYWRDMGYKLATLHSKSHEFFGLEYNNYIGSLPQINAQNPSWSGFFCANRLEYQFKMAVNSGKMDGKYSENLSRLCKQLSHILPDEVPALIHGDLWSGNLMTGDQGEPVLIDPAVYYGHREVEIAFTKLFGGFDAEMYSSYQEVLPLSPGFEERIEIHNLYPLMVHVNLFGGGYISQVETILRRF